MISDERLKLDGMLEDAYEHGYHQAKYDYEVQPCEDAVSREAAKKLYCNICMDKNICYRNKENCEELNLFDKLPPVTSKQRTGKWELTDDEQSYRCSCCKNHWISASEYLDVWKYCPCCGAKMEGESE